MIKENLKRDRAPPQGWLLDIQKRVGGRALKGLGPDTVWRAASIPETWSPGLEPVWQTARLPATWTPLQSSSSSRSEPAQAPTGEGSGESARVPQFLKILLQTRRVIQMRRVIQTQDLFFQGVLENDR